MSKVKYYTVYLNSTDEIVCSGTARECAKVMNKSVNCFHSLVSKNRLHRQNKYTVYTEMLDQIDDEEDENASF